MTNTPIGIPSGWEEIAAEIEASSWFPKIDGYNYELQVNYIPSSYYASGEHDWRVVE